MLRGHLRFMVMNFLEKESLTGYELLKRIKDATGWKPSYGSIYPVLDTLKKEKLILGKIDGKRIIYHLSSKGKSYIRKTKDSKNEILSSMQEQLNMLEHICHLDMSLHKYMMEEMQKGNIPLREVHQEIQMMNSELYRIMKRGLFTKNVGKIRSALSESARKLSRIS